MLHSFWGFYIIIQILENIKRGQECHLVGKCVTRTQRTSWPPDSRTDSVELLRLVGSRKTVSKFSNTKILNYFRTNINWPFGFTLLQPHTIRERRVNVIIIKPLCNNRQDQNGNYEKQGEPEVGVAHSLFQRAYVRRPDYVIIRVGEREIAQDGRNYGYEVDHCPVRRLQCNLVPKRKHKKSSYFVKHIFKWF